MNLATEFEGQVGIVTGAADGIGFAISKLLAQRAASVALWDVNLDAAERAANRIHQETGAKAKAYKVDVTTESDVLAARDATIRDFGRADVLVNNAGIYPHASVSEITEESWNRMFDVNTKGAFHAMRALMGPMTAQKYGRMVSIVTEDAYIAKPTLPHYAASKAALLSLIKTFALELAPHEVICTGVSPGPVATERAKSQSWLAPRISKIPVLRAAEPEDIAEVVLFLGSKRNRFVVGETVIANGGYIMV
ncbi:MAG: SDR family NAD(P)-dependent oxidoreductase [Alphaproteobacteria bacterium]